MCKSRIPLVSQITAGIAIGFTLLALWWGLWPHRPLVINSVKISPIEVVSGGTLHFEVDYCKNTDRPEKASMQLVNTLLYTYETFTSNLPKGCHTVINDLYIPYIIPEGEYIIRTTTEYELNPIRTIKIISETEKFQIIK